MQCEFACDWKGIAKCFTHGVTMAGAVQVIELPIKHPELFESLGVAQPKVHGCLQSVAWLRPDCPPLVFTAPPLAMLCEGLAMLCGLGSRKLRAW